MPDVDCPSEEAFRQEVLTFLEATLPAKGDEASGVISFGGSGLSRSVAYQRQLADAGLAGITWPAEYGGRGLPGRYQRIYDREAKAFQVPPRSLEIGLGMCGPTLLVHASEEQKKTFIPPLLRGDHVWCELFSEPGRRLGPLERADAGPAGRRRVRPAGQKVWTSGAQHSDYAACLVRTDPARPKREGITMLIVDMHVPGITVRPLRQITGDSHFNEVFLDEVRVPVANVVGEVDDGWRVARTMLAFERQALGNMGGGGGGKGGFTALAEEAKRRDLAHRPVLRDRLVQLRIRQMVLRHLTAYLLVKAKGGDGAAASVLKLAMAQLVQESALVAVETAGMHAIAWTADDPDGGRWSDQLLSSQSASIGGGTNQIVRNVIAERVLGLPRDAEGDLMPGDLGDARTTAARRRRRAQERLVATEHPPAPLPPGSQAQVLSGLRVVEIGQYVAAPLAGTIFADLGADVIKVERPGGDPMRADPARFAAWNRGKETRRARPAHPPAAPTPWATSSMRPTCSLRTCGRAPWIVSGWRRPRCGPAGPAWSPVPSALGAPTGRHATSPAGSRSCTPGPAHSRACSRGRSDLAPLPRGQRRRRRWWRSWAPPPR